MSNPITALARMSVAPSDDEAFRTWLSGADALEFLRSNAADDELILYATLGHSFLNTVVVPSANVQTATREDLLSWNFNAYEGWGITHSFSAESLEIAPPLDHPGSKAYEHAEQLVFVRTFDGRLGNKRYVEMLQRFIQVFDLHFLEERSAYCRIDERGDIEETIRIVEISGDGESRGGLVVTCRRDFLDQYATLTNSVLVRTFDFTRYRERDFAAWPGEADPTYHTEENIQYRIVLEDGYGSYVRGVQIISSRLSKEELLRRFDYSDKTDREYASFIAHDFKNKVIREISTEPGATANYFTKSDLPFETSPAFFRPDVLQKYKADTDKYRLENRSISCRDTWSLQTYDISEAGQVHTYIVYLRRLPYEEQLHWKAYNEKPKAPISTRAFKTDFEGNWDLEYDPLESLRQALRELGEAHAGWWTLRSTKLLDQVHYPVTTSADEWANEILQLDQLLVEGFEEKWLRAKAKELGRNVKPELRSLKLVEECLVGFGFDEEAARTHLSPLHDVHNLRSKVKGHASGQEAVAIRKQALREHKSYSQHFRQLCAKCDELFRMLTEVFQRHRDEVKND